MLALTASLAICFQQSHSLEEAICRLDAGQLCEASRELAALDPLAPRVARTAGVLHFRLSEYAKAIESLLMAARREEPSSVEFKHTSSFLGQSYFLTAHMPEAAAWLEKASLAGMKSTGLYYMLGVAYIPQREAAKAGAAFRPAV